MRYKSTRGGSDGQTFEEVVMRGLAPDGGLYVPESVPKIDNATIDKWSALPFDQLAVEIAALFIEDEVPREDLQRLMKASFATFSHQETTPVRKLSPQLCVLELFHGPTFAFKDVALQFLGNLFEYFLERRKARGEAVEPITVLGATSGDTGSAAIYGLRGKRNVDVFILHPRGRVAPVQERQMTTVLDDNVHNIAVDGTFDDCQNLVKACFQDQAFNAAYALAAINSINWARILAQIVYYFHAYAQFRTLVGQPHGYPPVVFCVPTGNFGDVLAGFYAKRMGLPIAKLVIATNENDIVHRFLETGRMTQRDVKPTIAPAMDIQISSNFERYLHHLCDEDAPSVAQLMDDSRRTGDMAVAKPLHDRARNDFASFAADEDTIVGAIKKYHAEHDYVLCPHTACGVAAAEHYLANQGADETLPVVCLATAHPAKFNDAVRDAIGKEPEYPPALEAIQSLPTRCLYAKNDMDAVKDIVARYSTRNRTLRARNELLAQICIGLAVVAASIVVYRTISRRP